MTRMITAIFAMLMLTSGASGEIPTYVKPLEHVGPPLPRQAVTNRAFTGISSMAVAPNGRLWVTWYAGETPGEDRNNYVVLSTSGDGGKTWEELLIVDPDGEGLRRTFDPEVWISPDGKLRWFFCDRELPYNNVKTDALWMIVVDDPNSETSEWHPPVYVAQGVMMCKPVLLSTGEWALPVCTWFSENSSKMVQSTLPTITAEPMSATSSLQHSARRMYWLAKMFPGKSACGRLSVKAAEEAPGKITESPCRSRTTPTVSS